jgi:excisionase family DNA binding protein
MKTYTVKEVATMLRRNPETIRRWLRVGRLKGIKVGKDYIIREKHIEELFRK